MLITKDEIKKLIDEKLTDKEKEYYRKYLRHMVENQFICVQYFLKNKRLFFTHMK